MATIVRGLSAKTDKTGKAEILLRVIIDGTHKQRLKSGIYITASRFNEGKIIKPRANRKEAEELSKIENELIELERFILSLCQRHSPDILTKDFFLDSINVYRNPEDKVKTKLGVFEALTEMIETSPLVSRRLDHYKVLYRELYRFEGWKKKTSRRYLLSLDKITDKTIEEFVDFLKNEPQIAKEYPELYKEDISVTGEKGKSRSVNPKGQNTISSKLKLFRAFYNWAIKKEYAEQNPFSKYSIPGEKYGTPFYLSIEERNKVADYDFSEFPDLAIQRDIFIFQCLIGCRVSDLYSLTAESIINGAVEYIPSKTKGERPEVVRVPLNLQAKEIIERYKGQKKTLFPFIVTQDYNYAIRKILRIVGINRMVTVLNPTTGAEEKKPIHEVASSHMARRTFIGNLYKKVKDPNLVGSLSGHKEGSRAFARYRDIDEDMKKELVNML